jgi:DNA-binding protein HU-beta
VNRAELVARMARDAGLTKADADRALDAFLDNVSRSLKKGEKVKLVGFGVFDVYRRKPRAGRDPHSGAPIRIPGRRVTRFTAGKELKALVK